MGLIIIPSPLGAESTEWSMQHTVSTQQIFIIVIIFIIHFKVHIETTKLMKLLGQIPAILYKIVSVAILNAFTSSFASGSYLFFINIEQNITFQSS